jgi:hypothetical protein
MFGEPQKFWKIRIHTSRIVKHGGLPSKHIKTFDLTLDDPPKSVIFQPPMNVKDI